MKVKIVSFLFIFFMVGMTLLIIMRSELTIDFSKFDENIWNKYPEKRYEMIEDFETKYSLESLTSEKASIILGDNAVTKTNNLYSYVISDGFMMVKYYALIFNDQGECINRYIYID